MSYEWTDMSYLELLAGNTAMILFTFAVIMVFLVLAAQYESWSLPLSVILNVPMTILSAIVGVWVTGGDNNPQVDRLPLEAVIGWDTSLNGNLAQLLQEPSLMGAYEGAGITVVAKGAIPRE